MGSGVSTTGVTLTTASDWWLNESNDRRALDQNQGTARAAVEAINTALECIIEDPESKENQEYKAKIHRLLGTWLFAANLEFYEVFGLLQRKTKQLALKVGQDLNAYYEAEELRVKLGGLQVATATSHVLFDSPGDLRQDDAAIGLPTKELVAFFAQRQPDPQSVEIDDVSAHLLRFVACMIDDDFSAACRDIAASCGGNHIHTVPKGHARMMNKAASIDDHRFARPPRVARNIDVVRCAMSFSTPDALLEAVTLLEARFGAAVRAKNGYSLETEQAAEQFHYRALMLNWCFDTNKTYGELVGEHGRQLDEYVDEPPQNPASPWSRWHRYAGVVADFLRSEVVRDLPVRLICETQLILEPYLRGRKRMHLLYKIARSPDGVALYNDFRSSPFEPKSRYSLEQATAEGEVKAVLSRAKSKSKDNSRGGSSVAASLTELLLKHAALGHLGATTAILACRSPKVNCDYRDPRGHTALWVAAQGGHVDVVKALLSRKADANAPDSEGSTPLWIAAQNGHVDVARVLLAAKRINLFATDREGATPLYMAVDSGHHDVVAMLLSRRTTRVDSPDTKGRTPLFVACQRGFERVVSLLLDTKAVDVNVRTHTGATCLSTALDHGYTMIANRLLAHPDIDVSAVDDQGRSCLQAATEKGQTGIVTRILSLESFCHEDDASDASLLAASRQGNVDVVRLLLDQEGTDVNAWDDNGRTPLWHAASAGHVAIVSDLLKKDGIDVSASDEDGHTPLCIAIQNRHTDVVQEILAAGHKIELQHEDSCAHQLLASSARGDVQMVDSLLGSLVDHDIVNSQDAHSHSPLMLASLRGRIDVVRRLLAVPCLQVNAADDDGYTALHMGIRGRHSDVLRALLQHPGVDVNFSWGAADGDAYATADDDDGGHPPLWLAAHARFSSGIRQLLAHPEVDVNAASGEDKTTPLMLLVKRAETELVQVLLNHGDVEVNQCDDSGRTALHEAALRGNVEIARALLGKTGIDVSLEDEDGFSAIELADAFKHQQVVALLVDAGAELPEEDEEGDDSEEDEYGEEEEEGEGGEDGEGEEPQEDWSNGDADPEEEVGDGDDDENDGDASADDVDENDDEESAGR